MPPLETDHPIVPWPFVADILPQILVLCDRTGKVTFKQIENMNFFGSKNPEIPQTKETTGLKCRIS